ncbi:MAG: hypothetical protein Q4G51_12475 [Dermatophilus congolensis]|nr:hypothetical protein [Dermatophilus congolensis]
MSAVPGPGPVPQPPASGGGAPGSNEQAAAVEAAVGRFEGIDPSDLGATLAGGESLSDTLTHALDEDSRRDGGR